MLKNGQLVLVEVLALPANHPQRLVPGFVAPSKKPGDTLPQRFAEVEFEACDAKPMKNGRSGYSFDRKTLRPDLLDLLGIDRGLRIVEVL